MNFIMKFFSNHYDDDIYDAILIIIDRFFENDALHIRKINTIDQKSDRRSF